MRFSTRALAMALALCLAPAAAHAEGQAKGLGDWSVVGSQVNTGKAFEDVRVGWPSLDFGYTMQLGPASDIGFRFGLFWGDEFVPYAGFGLGLWAPIRFQLTKGQDKLNWLLHVDPGFRINFGSSYCSGYNFYYGGYCGSSSTTFGITAPVGVVAGYPVMPGLEVGGGADVKLGIFFGGGTTDFVIAPMVGPYAEYQLKDPNISFGLTTRFGAAIHTASGVGTYFAWDLQATVGYRLF
jgi:hypothetical protein